MLFGILQSKGKYNINQELNFGQNFDNFQFQDTSTDSVSEPNCNTKRKWMYP